MSKENYSQIGKGTGALRDPHDPKNFKHREIFGVSKAPLWREKSPEQWKRYGDIRDQYTSGSCVGQTIALLIAIENFREEGKFNHFSARPVYAKNYVAPDGGMYPSNGFKYGSEYGVPFEIQLRSQLIDEMSMRVISDESEGDRIVAKVFRGGPYVEIDVTNTDGLCSVLDRGKGVGISIRFDGDLSPDRPQLSKNGRYGHEIAVVDYGIFMGQKGFVYQNSWGIGWGFKGLGFIPLDAFTKGCDSIFYFEDLINKLPEGEAVEKPKHKFTKTLKLGTNNTEVGWLQLCLAYLKLFPLQQTGITNYYGGITRQAVKKYQESKGLVQTGDVDSKTLQKLNEDFN